MRWEIRMLNNKGVRALLAGFLVMGALLAMGSLPPVQIDGMPNFMLLLVLGYLVLGLVFFMFNQPRLTLICFGCCAAMSLFLKLRTDAQVEQPREVPGMPVLKVAHFNATSLQAYFSHSVEQIRKAGVDVVIVDEIDRAGDSIMGQVLGTFFPNHWAMLGSEGCGIAIFSRFSVESADTVRHDAYQWMDLCLEVTPRGDFFQLLTFHTNAGFSWRDYSELNDLMDRLGREAAQVKGPFVLAGNFYLLPWSEKMKQFRSGLRLHDSRTGREPLSNSGDLPLWEVPVDQIFFSSHFSCLDFYTFRSEGSHHLGIMSTLQFLE